MGSSREPRPAAATDIQYIHARSLLPRLLAPGLDNGFRHCTGRQTLGRGSISTSSKAVLQQSPAFRDMHAQSPCERCKFVVGFAIVKTHA